MGFFCLFTCPVTLHYNFTLTTPLHYLCVQFRDSYRKEIQHERHGKTHLTSNVSFEDRCIDINIKIHPLLQHVDNSLKLGNISQDLQGEQDNRE